MVARDIRPISVVEEDGFRQLMNYIEPGYRVPSHTHIATMCRRIFSVKREKLKDEIGTCAYIALTNDIWTSHATESYLTVTIHFIDNMWKICSRVLSTEEMPERHTGQNIAERLIKIADEWNIKAMQISAIVHDNAANAVCGVEKTDWSHFGCVGHTLQLCINSGLSIPAISRVIAASRKLVGRFKHSVVAMTALKENLLGIASHHLIQDVLTCWNSTFLMFERLVEQRVAIYAVLCDSAITTTEYKYLDLKEDQWELLIQIVTVFKPLQIATTVISSEQNVSCSVIYPVINGLVVNHLTVAKSDLPVVKRFKECVSCELKRCFNPSSLDTAKSLPVLCAAIDPRYAHLKFLSTQQKQIVREELISRMEFIEIEGTNEEADPEVQPAKKKQERQCHALSSWDFVI